MNQQMHLLEARAMAREREHQLQLRLRGGADERQRASRPSSRRLRLPSLGRHRAAQASSGRSTGVVAARG